MTAELQGAGYVERGISRRDFLRLGVTAAGGVGLERRLLRSPEEESVESVVRFRFGGDHLLSPDDIKDSDGLILGETSLGKDLVLWKSEDSRFAEEFARPDTLKSIFRGISRSTVSASESSREDHVEALAKAKQQGTQLVITDEWHSRTLSIAKQSEYADLRATAQQRSFAIASTALVGVVTSILHGIRKESAPKTLYKDGIKASVGMLPVAGAVAALGYFYGSEFASVLEKSGVLPEYAQSMNSIMELLGSLGDREKQQLFHLTDIRNASMALNTQLVEESLRQMPQLQTAFKRGAEHLGKLFFAGTAHAPAETLYRKGSWHVSEVVAQLARETIGFSQSKYHEATGIEEKEAALEDWILLTGPYNYPIPTYANRIEFQRGPERNLPLSSRAILWRELLVTALEDPGDRGLQQMGEKLLLEDYAFQYLMSDLYDGYDGIEFSERQAMMDRAKRIGLRKHNYPVVNLFKIYDADPQWQLVISEGVPFLFRIED